MKCDVYELNTLGSYKYVVVMSRMNGKIMLSRHKKRSTWETQGGHIESGETPLDAAKRELFEESGAVEFSIEPVFDYRAGDGDSWGNGVVFAAEIKALGDMPPSEMKEVGFFDTLPDNLTYPDITPVLFREAEKL